MQMVENQISACYHYVNSVKKEGDEIIEFQEPETSSRIPAENRTHLQEMLNFIEEGDTLVIYMLDRLARYGQELINIYYDLVDDGIIVHSVMEPKADKTYVHLYAMLAMMERENIQARTITALKRKQADMEKVGAVWYGYKLDESVLNTHERARTYNKPYKLIPDEKEAEQVALMVEWRKEGLSYGEIARELDARGYKNRSGNPPEKSTVFRVLQRLKKQHQAPKDLVCA